VISSIANVQTFHQFFRKSVKQFSHKPANKHIKWKHNLRSRGNTRMEATANRSRVSIHGPLHRVKIFLTCSLNWSPCKIWLLFLILCASESRRKGSDAPSLFGSLSSYWKDEVQRVIPVGWRQEGHPATKTLLQFL